MSRRKKPFTIAGEHQRFMIWVIANNPDMADWLGHTANQWAAEILRGRDNAFAIYFMTKEDRAAFKERLKAASEFYEKYHGCIGKFLVTTMFVQVVKTGELIPKGTTLYINNVSLHNQMVYSTYNGNTVGLAAHEFKLEE